MAKKISKNLKRKPKKEKRVKREKIIQNKVKKESKIQTQKKQNHHKFIVHSGLMFQDIVCKVIPLKDGKYGALSESGMFQTFTINEKKEIKQDLIFQIPGANLFCQLGNGLLVFNSFDYISLFELKGKKLSKIGEYQTIFSLVIYFMEPINGNFCAISGPNDIIELIQYSKSKKINVIYIDYKKSKLKNKKNKKIISDFSAPGIWFLYYQKKNKRLLATHFDNTLRIWNCDFEKNKYELFKEIENVTSFTGKIVHEIKNRILVGGKGVITILDNNSYEIIDYVDLGNSGYEIFSMEVINYYNFKEFVICGLRNGKILGVDIEKKKIEFTKKKINDSGKDNELIVKDGKLSFYGENISYISKVENTNMILVASHNHYLTLYEY